METKSGRPTGKRQRGQPDTEQMGEGRTTREPQFNRVLCDSVVVAMRSANLGIPSSIFEEPSTQVSVQKADANLGHQRLSPPSYR